MDPEAVYNRIWDILVEHAGARPDGWEREVFVRDYATNPGMTEWRFQGDLGFGGKFWRHNLDKRYRISCYPEDETPERLATIERVNALLKDVPFFCP